MSKPTRFPNGINNAVLPSVLENMGQLDPTRFHIYFDDFNFFNVNVFTRITTENGSDQSTENIFNHNGGVVILNNDDADNDNLFIAIPAENFIFTANKKLFFKARFRVSDSNLSDFILGLQITAADPLAVTDGVFFRKDSGSTDLNLFMVKNSTTSTASAIHTMVDDTFVEVGFVYNGVDKVDYFVNNQRLGFLDTTNLPDDELLRFIFGVQNGEAVIKTMSLDYVLVANER